MCHKARNDRHFFIDGSCPAFPELETGCLPGAYRAYRKQVQKGPYDAKADYQTVS